MQGITPKTASSPAPIKPATSPPADAPQDSVRVASQPSPPQEPPPDRSCTVVLAEAMDLYQDARRSAHGPAPESAFSRAADALEKAMARCAAESPWNWRAAALALANSHYLSSHYASSAAWYREAVRRRPSGADDRHPMQMAEILTSCASDTRLLDIMRLGSLKLTGEADSMARREALLLFEGLRKDATCLPMQKAATQSIEALRRQLGLGSTG
ncbi:MAG TPA: hypothetical protein VGE72_03765 [Azospirillum sp.]